MYEYEYIPFSSKPVMACRLFGTKPLPEPMLTQFTDVYMGH